MKTYPISIFSLVFFIFSIYFSNTMFAQNNALKFDGIDDEVKLGNWFNYDSFTISLWINPGDKQVNYANIIDNNHSGDNQNWVVQQNYKDTNYYYFANHYGLCYFTLNPNEWQMLTFTQEKNGVKKLFINSKLIDSTSTSNNSYYSQFLTLANWGGGGRNWNGMMDELQIWRKPLNIEQISDLLYKKISGNEDGLVAYYDFNSSSGDTLYDKTQFKHHGVLKNNPVWVSSKVIVGAKVIPNKAGNTNVSTIKIYDNLIKKGAVVKLTKVSKPDIIADTVLVNDDGTIATCIFDFTGKDTGLYDVHLMNPDTTEKVYFGALTIEKGVAPDVWVDIIGKNAVRNGRPFTFLVNYGNRGNVDAKGVVLWVAVPQNVKLKLGFNLYSPDSSILINDTLSYYIDVDTFRGKPNKMRIIPIFISRILPNQTYSLKFSLDSITSIDFIIEAWINDPWFQSPLKYVVGDCTDKVIGLVSGVIPGAGCVYSAMDLVGNLLIEPFFDVYDFTTGKTITAKERFENGINVISFPLVVAKSIIKAGIGCIPGAKAPELTLKVLKNIIDFTNSDVYKYGSVGLTCAIAFERKFASIIKVKQVNSYDPNEKVGPDKYKRSDSPFSYVIYFENKDTAKASAQEVFIVDTLDKTKFDLSTFTFGQFGFGDTFFTSTFPLQKQFTKDIDLRPNVDLIVRSEARLDTSTGVLYWKFRSLDPMTLDLTEDPLLGFLPPNKIAPEGEGWISYSVRPKSDLVTGDKIENKAWIVFDLNTPIGTNRSENFIDDVAPVSSVQPLGIVQKDSNFKVSWQGSDVGSGIRSYDILVKDDTGKYYHWLHGVSNTSAVFQGHNGHTYRFYSVATDSAGNIEKDSTPVQITKVSFDSRIDMVNNSGVVLHQNYPNPFDERTSIGFTAPNSSIASIVLIDIYGRVIYTIENIEAKPGLNEVVFESKNLTSGIYYYQLKIGDAVLTKVMVVK